jgi:RNase adaptor protein for sRNA GlmZ degradation
MDVQPFDNSASNVLEIIMKYLKVSINSFSFKKGIPEDPAGNGGGHVFDCRCLENPGLLNEYQALTGLDDPVVQYLQQHSDADKFIEHAMAIIMHSIDAYKKCGYTDLMVSFGCTGGQHRSVYCAESVARNIRGDPDIFVALQHREQPTLS